ncbi:MAG: recombinase family protein [Candidatus Kerfeldbacteria bacterium]|nr:recombinase family protein [Candidatus Kerfeldbacteria bacterium]
MPIYTHTAPVTLPQVIDGVIQKSDAPVAKTKPLTFCLYARKSSEDDERQALSIDSQIKEMLDRAKLEKMKVKDVRQESYSAKQSGQRPVFNELLTDIRKGTFNGILTWAPDRLSRNAGDLGILVDLMDSGHLEAIRTHGQTFTNTPNDKFLLMILCSQAKLENDNRGENVKRGLRAKAQMGFRPGMTPLGYLNEPDGVKVASDKRSRLMSVSSLIQTGKIKFSRHGNEELVRQIVGFGIERHDDLVDAFTIVGHKAITEDGPAPGLFFIDIPRSRDPLIDGFGRNPWRRIF